MTIQEIIEKTKKLIAIPSTADRPEALRQAVKFVRDIAAKCPNVTIEDFEQNGKSSFLAYSGKVRPEKFDILLNGHVDVVPAAPGMFEPYEKDDRLYGRGALDMKGTTLTMTDVFCELVNEVPYALGLQIVCDEEIGGYDCTDAQIKQGVRANFVVAGEYANDRQTIYNEARGLCWAEIAFDGKTAHGGQLWHGSNAIVKAGNFAAAVLQRYPTPDHETWTSTASIAHISTPNDTFNKVPDSAVLKIDFRFTQEDEVFKSRESLLAFLHSIDPEARLVKALPFEPAVHVPILNPYVQGLSRAVQEVSGVKPKYRGRPAGSDGRHYALVQNEIVEFGIYGKHSHSEGEYAELSSFDEYQRTLRTFLRDPIPKRLAKAPSATEPLQETILRKLVSIRTTSGNKQTINEAIAYIADFLKARGMHTEIFDNEGNRSVIATTKPGDKHPTVLLNAHVDVVPGPDKLFNLRRVKDKFLGRGVMDMKHAIATYLTVVDNLKDELESYSLGVMITCDEEIGGNDGVKPLVRELKYRPKVVVVPDGGNNWELETFAKGVKWVTLTANGKVAHASRPWEGESAIMRLLGAIYDIEKLMPANPQKTDTFMTIGTIKGGQVANQIPVKASAVLDIRTGSVADHKRLTPAIKSICKAHGLNASFQADEPPCVTDPENPWVKSFVDIVRQVTKREHGYSYDFAVTDGRIFSEAGIPTIVINPECGNIHREDEWLSRNSLADFCKVMEMYVRRMAVSQPQVEDDQQAAIHKLLGVLSKQSKSSAYVWYASYGSGLYKKNFVSLIKGLPQEGTTVRLKGCRDTSDPVKDVFTHIPYRLYFSGKSKIWGEGMGRVEPSPDPSAHTLARMYLITLEQFEDLYKGMNENGAMPKGALQAALKHGLATIGDGTRDYDGLVFCGMREGCPILTLTAPEIRTPYAAPSAAYTQSLCKGVAEAAGASTIQSIEHILAAPGLHNNSLASEQFSEKLRQALAKAGKQRTKTKVTSLTKTDE